MSSSGSFRHAQLPEDQEGSPDEIWQDEQPRRTTVVHVNSPNGYDVYIGRANSRRGLPWSKWHNSFRIGPDGTREQVIAAYRAKLLATPVLMSQLADLKGKRLGCWCKPLTCHGDILAELTNALP